MDTSPRNLGARELAPFLIAARKVASSVIDALELLAESALEGDLDPGTAGDRYQVMVHISGGAVEKTEQPGVEDGVF